MTLKPGTRVQGRMSGRVGTVQKGETTVGSFPVRWNDGQWVLVGWDDVSVLSDTKEVGAAAAITGAA